MATIQKITPCLWFDGKAEEASRFYTTVFKNSKMGRIAYYTKEAAHAQGMPEGAVITVEFEIENHKFLALNGGPHFKFNEAVSFIVNCDTQDEIDYFWNKLGEGGDGKAQQCGWLKDKFGLSWQIAPSMLSRIMTDGTEEQRGRVMSALMQMKKLDIAELENAYQGKQLA